MNIEDKKNTKISVRLSDSERAFLEKLMVEKGYRCLSNFLRNLIFESALKLENQKTLNKISKDDIIISTVLLKKLSIKFLGEEETKKIIDTTKEKITRKYGEE